MKLFLVRPFRVPFNLPKYRFLANNPEWRKVVTRAKSDISRFISTADTFSEFELGNYGWNNAPETIYQFDHPGWFFKDFYLARFGGALTQADFAAPCAAPLRQHVDVSGSRWQCWLIDNTLAVLVTRLAVTDASVFVRFLDQRRAAYREFNEHWPQTLLGETGQVKTSITRVADWCAEHLLTPFSKKDPGIFRSKGLLLPGTVQPAAKLKAPASDQLGVDEPDSNLFTAPHPIYNTPYRGLWTHTVYCFESRQRNTDKNRLPGIEILSATPAGQVGEDELGRLLKDAKSQLLNVLGETHLGFLQRRQSCYGNGWTALVEARREAHADTQDLSNAGADSQQLKYGIEGLVVMQYFYSCFDIADTLLPTRIARSQQQLAEHKYQAVLSAVRQSQFELSNLINDYNDLRIRAAFEAGHAVREYHESWRMASLMDNIHRKQSTMEGLVSNASDAIDKRSESGIQLILLGISALSLIGLFASLHQYLSGGYEARFADPLQQWALSWEKWQVTIFTFALVAVLAMLAAWMLLRDSIRQSIAALKRKFNGRH